MFHYLKVADTEAPKFGVEVRNFKQRIIRQIFRYILTLEVPEISIKFYK